MGEHTPFNWFTPVPLPVSASTAIFVALLLAGLAAVLRGKLRSAEAALEPEDGVTLRNCGEVFVEMMSALAEGAIGQHAERYVPLLASFFAFILVANLIGLVPGLEPPTADFNVTFALGVVAFVAYHAYGMRAHGVGKYVRHFLGPVAFLAPLMLPIELFSHSFRPLSLGIRLFANMFADHQVVEIFTGLTKVAIPVIFYVLGAFVAVVQAFVFTMLSAIYIALAVSHE